jgi:hypothetical protein
MAEEEAAAVAAFERQGRGTEVVPVVAVFKGEAGRSRFPTAGPEVVVAVFERRWWW